MHHMTVPSRLLLAYRDHTNLRHNVFIDNRDLTAGLHRPCTGTRTGRLYPLFGDRLAAPGFGTRFLCKRGIKNAFPLPHNLRELHLPLRQAFTQVVPPNSTSAPIAPPLPPIEEFVKGDTLAVVLVLAPGIRIVMPGPAA
jgi:hypothetical protein